MNSTPVVAAAAGKIHDAGKRMRVGRGVPKIISTYNKICSCLRERTTVFCRACGFYCHGRVRLRCQKHPHVAFLCDITECPRCHSSTYLDEYSAE